MTSKDKKLKAIIELVSVQSRIDELKRSKTYLSTSSYYRNRLTQLEDKEEKLQEVIDCEFNGKESVDEIKLVFHVPESVFKGKTKEEDFVQYLKREYLVEA